MPMSIWISSSTAPSMYTSTYPGKGLSLSQLIFALNEELRRTAFSPSVTFDAVSQLERGLITALSTAREWKNSFVPINRIPLDLLSLIPTHLASHKDRFRASFVCRHWRTTFLQHGALWSQLFLTKGKEYVTTILERAKESALEIITDRNAPLGAITPLSPHARRIRRLEFKRNYLTDVLAFSEASSGPLPFLRTLRIYLLRPRGPHDQSDSLTAPLFSGAVNLEKFVLNFKEADLLKHFVFPNLTVFKLGAFLMDGLNASDLFDFLKRSPTLRTVEVQLAGGIILGNIPQDVVIVLPNVETFSLFVKNFVRNNLYEPVARISCPRAKSTSLTQEIYNHDMATGLDMFPDPISWKEITRQYGSSPVEEVTLKMGNNYIEHSLVFRASDATVIILGFEVINTSGEEEEEEDDFDLTWEEMHLEIFFQACKTIQAHPLLSHVKRLHIKDTTRAWGPNNLIPAAKIVVDLFKSLGPLDELTINSFDLQIFLAPFVGAAQFLGFERVFPPVKELTVSVISPAQRRLCLDPLVELAKSQHKSGIPFEHVTVRAREVPTDTMERLRDWVSAADCCEM